MKNKATVAIKPTGVFASGVVDAGRAREIFKRYVQDENAGIVDIGCGNGFFLSQLGEDGYVSISGVEAVHYPAPGKFPVTFADMCSERLPWHDASCDAVTAWEVFEHVENPRHAIREIHRILKPGGFLFISLPNVFHLMSRLMFLRQGNVPRWTEKNDHYNIFTHHVFNKTFRAHFNLVEKAYCIPDIGKGFLHPVVSRLTFLNRYLPENELFSHFVIYVLKKI